VGPWLVTLGRGGIVRSAADKFDEQVFFRSTLALAGSEIPFRGTVRPLRREREETMPDDKPRPNFSNVRSGESSTAPAAPSPPSTPASTAAPAATPSGAAPRTYTVVAGDNLSKIAKHFYGDANKWKRIFEANRDTIKNPDLIHPGQVLKIPDA
jgi:nucleoid-associated protein YgaU